MCPGLSASVMESGRGEVSEAAGARCVRSPAACPGGRLAGQPHAGRLGQPASEVADVAAEVRVPTMLWLAMVAHDLRNEVQAALLAKDLLDFVVADPRGREAVTILEHQLRRIGELARALGDEGGPLAAERDAPDPDVAEVLFGVAFGRPGVVIEAPPGLRTTCPRGDLNRIAGNLVANALVHGQPPVEIRARRCGAFVTVTVTDGGPGIPAELVATVFEPFARDPDRSHPGQGLGLAIVKDLCAKNNGRVDLEQATPGATRFTVQLPLAGEADR
jgi:two-component system, OmpR family, sensor histidine kinase MtrB